MQKKSLFRFVLKTDLFFDSDILILNIFDSNIDSFQLINIYNEKDQTDEFDQLYTINGILKNINLSNETLILNDFNAHHFGGNSEIQNFIRNNELIHGLFLYQFELINESHIYIFKKLKNNETNVSESVIDLIFVTNKLYSNISNGFINELNHIDSDHELIKINIQTKDTELIDNFIFIDFFNIKKANGKEFDKELIYEVNEIRNFFDFLNFIQELEAAALIFKKII